MASARLVVSRKTQELTSRYKKTARLVNMGEKYEFDGLIHEVPDNGGAYVIFPWDIRKVFGKGRVKVHAEFDGIPYEGIIVNMGVKDGNGSVCYIIGILKAIRKQLNKGDGDSVHVVIRERDT